MNESESQRYFRSLLFTRIVPTLRDIGLFGDRVKKAFADMGVLGYTDINVEELSAADEAVAESIDEERRLQVEETIAAGSAPA
jgi:hypothetical protein